MRKRPNLFFTMPENPHIIARCWNCRAEAGSNADCPVCTRLKAGQGLEPSPKVAAQPELTAALERLHAHAQRNPRWQKRRRHRAAARTNRAQLPPSDRE